MVNYVKGERPENNQTVIVEVETKKVENLTVVTKNIYCGEFKNRAEAYEAYKSDGIHKRSTQDVKYSYGLLKLNKVEGEGINYFIRTEVDEEAPTTEEPTGDALNASE